MKHKKDMKIGDFCGDIFPTAKDSFLRISVKLFYLLAVIGTVASVVGFSAFLDSEAKEAEASKCDIELLKDGISAEKSAKKLKAENPDYKAWLYIPGAGINNPVYQTKDNSFYLTHNFKKQENPYGALFFDRRSKVSDGGNSVIYGGSFRNGAMFSGLEKFRTLGFYRQNSVIKLVDDEVRYYIVYAVFVMNSAKKDDGDHIYNIYRDSFSLDEDFDTWHNEAEERSVIDTGVDVKRDDRILTLVTDCDDFEDARLVVMAREVRVNETVELSSPDAKTNPKPKFPKKWYEIRNIAYPF